MKNQMTQKDIKQKIDDIEADIILINLGNIPDNKDIDLNRARHAELVEEKDKMLKILTDKNREAKETNMKKEKTKGKEFFNFEGLQTPPEFNFGSKEPIFYHPDKCDCVECTNVIAGIKEQIADCEQDILVMEGKLENESILPLERGRLENDVTSWKGELIWMNQKLTEMELKKKEKVQTFSNGETGKNRRKLFRVLCTELAVAEGAKKEAESPLYNSFDDAIYAQGRIDGVQKAIDILKKVWTLEDVNVKVNELMHEVSTRYVEAKASDVILMRGKVDGARFAHDIIQKLSSNGNQ